MPTSRSGFLIENCLHLADRNEEERRQKKVRVKQPFVQHSCEACLVFALREVQALSETLVL